jgi:hypothetical protein
VEVEDPGIVPLQKAQGTVEGEEAVVPACVLFGLGGEGEREGEREGGRKGGRRRGERKGEGELNGCFFLSIDLFSMSI